MDKKSILNKGVGGGKEGTGVLNLFLVKLKDVLYEWKGFWGFSLELPPRCHISDRLWCEQIQKNPN
jgi:hypothetical protein